jgi:hypothetical protein
MPLQNRVNPFGEIEAVAARGLMMGNRGGKLHRDDRTLAKRRWASTHWIACELQFRGRKRDVMGKFYTELFFLDEVTALAAGHRPCFECRRADAKAFLGHRRVNDFDAVLHAERLSQREAEVAKLPDGAMISNDGTRAYAVKGSMLLAWSYEGYGAAIPRAGMARARLLTPPLIVKILAQGYTPRWHPSAEIGEEP